MVGGRLRKLGTPKRLIPICLRGLDKFVVRVWLPKVEKTATRSSFVDWQCSPPWAWNTYIAIAIHIPMLKFLVNFIVLFALAYMILGSIVSNALASDMNTNYFEELRDNLVEVRLALQKGDLTEALQHLNNAEEQLLLLQVNMTSNSTVSH
ncbi:MAG: hypothetical protein M3297_13370 [Thermoproteota archaeon]|nr:hypothetical protein [Thermoproteota archaeon]